MKPIMKIELSRAFKSSGFYTSLFTGCVIAVAHCILNVFPYALRLTEYVAYNKPMMYPGWLYSLWIGGNVSTMPSYLFFLIIPLLASLPYGDSFFTDVKGGYIQNVCIRSNRKDYYRAKYVSAFISGGSAVSIPLVLNFFLCALLLPALRPEVASGTNAIHESSTFPYLYFSMPLLYVAVYVLIIFLFSGLFSALSLLSSYYVGYRFLVLISPFIVYLFLMSLFGLLTMENWQPNNFLHPAYYGNVLIPIISEFILFLLITVFGFIIKGPKDDIYS